MDCLFLTSRRHWWEQVNSTVIEFHLSNTSGSRQARTRIAHLVNRDANNCAISPPLYIWFNVDVRYTPTIRLILITLYLDKRCPGE